jgi:hypothetical protein
MTPPLAEDEKLASRGLARRTRLTVAPNQLLRLAENYETIISTG